jgi:hypothetical protein
MLKIFSMKKDGKKLLFEMMEKVNPDFKQVGEQTTAPMTGDVQQLQRVTTTTQQSANSRINTPDEFSQAFRVWFSSLGFRPDKNPIAIGRITQEVTKIMKELGFK